MGLALRVLVFAVGVFYAHIVHSEDLGNLLASGKAQLENTAGTGASSGSALQAELVNLTQAKIEVSVKLGEPVYFENGGVGQNMIAVGVFGRDGGYIARDDGEGFIEVGRGGRLPITFVAYCADFEKANPAPSEKFKVSPAPASVVAVAKLISDYEAAHGGTNNVAAMQFLLWRSQGVAAEKIREKFSVTREEEQIANELLATLQQ